MFLRTLLCNFASGLARPLGLDELAGLCRGEHHDPLWLELTGAPPAERQLNDEWRRRPGYFRRLRSMTNPALPLIKSHTMVCELEGRPAFELIAGDRIIHVVRHPGDVAVSLAAYAGVEPDDAAAWLVTDDLCHRGEPGGFELTGSWAQHTRGWMQDLGLPVFRLAYTQLLADPLPVLLQLAEFLELEVSRERARLAAEFSDLRRMQQSESESGFIETASSARGGYFRRGGDGQWRTRLSDRAIAAIRSHDPLLFSHFGFE